MESRTSRVAAAVAFVIVLAGAHHSQSDAWPMYQVDAAHTEYLPVALDTTA